MVLAGTVARYNVSVANAATSGVTSCTYAAATANPAIPQKFMGSLNAAFRYFTSILGNSNRTSMADYPVDFFNLRVRRRYRSARQSFRLQQEEPVAPN